MEKMYSEEMLRTLPCYHCIHCVDKDDMVRGRFQKRKCDLTNRWGRMNKANYCNCFENMQKKSSETEINGYRVRKDQLEDYRTECQWNDSGYIVKEGEKGKVMYASRVSAMNHGRVFEYFLPDQVTLIVEESPSEFSTLLYKTIKEKEGKIG